MYAFDQIAGLITFGIDEKIRYQSRSVYGLKSENYLAACNRATIKNNIDNAELEALDTFYATIPYAIWVDDHYIDATSKLIERGFSLRSSCPLMELDTNTVIPIMNNDAISIRRIQRDDELFTVWAPIVIQVFSHLKSENHKNELEQFALFLQYLQKTIDPEHLFFYLGFLDEIPVSTGMFIVNQNYVGVHWIATLLPFRNKGMGFAITHMPLYEFKCKGVQKALLWSSSSGYSIYEKIGFKKISNYEIYMR